MKEDIIDKEMPPKGNFIKRASLYSEELNIPIQDAMQELSRLKKKREKKDPPLKNVKLKKRKQEKKIVWIVSISSYSESSLCLGSDLENFSLESKAIEYIIHKLKEMNQLTKLFDNISFSNLGELEKFISNKEDEIFESGERWLINWKVLIS